MNVAKIKEIVNLGISDEQKERYILSIIADDKKAIPTILNILNIEREKREELILDSNAELSRALIVLKDDNLKYSKKIITSAAETLRMRRLNAESEASQRKSDFITEHPELAEIESHTMYANLSLLPDLTDIADLTDLTDITDPLLTQALQHQLCFGTFFI